MERDGPKFCSKWTFKHFSKWKDLGYEELCFEFLRHFATDIEPSVLREIVAKSYGKFDHEEIAPLKQLSPDLFILELFHGPTLAFKDFALQLLPKAEIPSQDTCSTRDHCTR